MGVRFRDGEDPADFIQQILDHHDDQLSGQCFTFLYAVWELRNGVIHQHKPINFAALMLRFHSLGELATHQPVVTTPAHNRNVARAVWTRPRGDVIKINFDAAWMLTVGAGLGFMARDENAQVMAAAMAHPVEAISPLVAEALAFRWSLSLAKDFNRCVVRQIICKFLRLGIRLDMVLLICFQF